MVNCLVKLAQEKSVARCTDHPDMTIAVDWNVQYQTKQAKNDMKWSFSYNSLVKLSLYKPFPYTVFKKQLH